MREAGLEAAGATGAGAEALPRTGAAAGGGGPAADAQVFVVEDGWPEFTADELDRLFPDGFPGWDSEHAAVVETSLMMVLLPGLVRRELIVDDRSPEHPPYDVLPAPARLLTQTGVLAKASDASDEKGSFLVQRMTDHLIEMLAAEFPDLVRG